MYSTHLYICSSFREQIIQTTMLLFCTCCSHGRGCGCVVLIINITTHIQTPTVFCGSTASPHCSPTQTKTARWPNQQLSYWHQSGASARQDSGFMLDAIPLPQRMYTLVSVLIDVSLLRVYSSWCVDIWLTWWSLLTLRFLYNWCIDSARVLSKNSIWKHHQGKKSKGNIF